MQIAILFFTLCATCVSNLYFLVDAGLVISKIETTARTGRNGLEASIREMGDKQFVSFNFTIDVPLGNEMFSNSLLMFSKNGKTWMPIMKTKQKNPCALLKRLLGSTWREMQVRAKMGQPGKCPIPKGNYYLKDYVLDISKIDMPLPKGFIKITDHLVKTDDKSLVFDYLALAENK